MISSDEPFQPEPSPVPSSWSSNFGVAGALASYRRSQYIVTEQNVATSPQTPLSCDIEADFGGSDEEDISETGSCLEDGEVTPLPRQDDGMMNTFAWDDINVPSTSSTSRPTTRPPLSVSSQLLSQEELSPAESSAPISSIPLTSERSPLLRKPKHQNSITFRGPAPIIGGQHIAPERALQPGNDRTSIVSRKISRESVQSEKPISGGMSTFGQTLFNSIAILVGFGMLSEPLAFSYAGWIGGTVLIVFYGLITCYTAKILARMILEDPRIRTYADIGNKAFGPRATVLTSTLFCLELGAVSVVLVTLFGDSLHSIVPAYSVTTYKLFSLVILIPTVLLPLWLLSFTSILGIISTLLVIGVVFVDGLSKPDAPGSLWSPAETRFGVSNWGNMGVAFGLFMAGFSGHAVLPSLAKDMANPRDFDRMINWAFAVATMIYAAIGACGYLMFGDAVSDEISRDLIVTPGYNEMLNTVAGCSLVIMPLTKFALTTRPVHINFEIMLGIETNPPLLSPENDIQSVPRLTSRSQKSTRILKHILMIIERSAITVLIVAISILIPDFASMMAFLGSFSAFTLCVIGPISAKFALTGRCSVGEAVLFFVAVVMAVWGTVAAFAV